MGYVSLIFYLNLFFVPTLLQFICFCTPLFSPPTATKGLLLRYGFAPYISRVFSIVFVRQSSPTQTFELNQKRAARVTNIISRTQPTIKCVYLFRHAATLKGNHLWVLTFIAFYLAYF